MKSYHVLGCDPLAEIQSHTMDYIHNRRPEMLDESDLWHKADTPEFLGACAPLVRWTRELGLRIREVAFTVSHSGTVVNPHIDEAPVLAKVNVPILNTRHTYNRWYDVPQQVMQDPRHRRTNSFGRSYHSFQGVALRQVDELELTSPAVFNSARAHDIAFTERSTYPRVVLTCMFHDEPKKFLEA